MTRPYSEGSVFLVPLTNGGYARGVVGRASPMERVLFGYFFGPAIATIAEASFDDIRPDNSILRVMFGDVGLTKKVWRVYGRVPQWDRTQWPIPDFIRRDEVSKKAWLVRYRDDDPSKVEMELPIEFDADLQRDSLSGYRAVEIKLSKLLCSNRRNEIKSGDDRPETPTHVGCASTNDTQERIHHYLYFPDKLAGQKVANALRTRGYVVEDRLGADKANWLVLAKSNATPTILTIEEQGQFLESMAKENNGEYEGWEADVV